MSVVFCSWGDALEGGGVEGLTLARKLAAESAAELSWLVIGGVAAAAEETAARYGVAVLDVISDAKLAAYGNDAVVAALSQYCAQRAPQTLIFNQNTAARTVVPLLAGRLGVPVVMNAFAVAKSGDGMDVTATAFGGDTHVVYHMAAAVNIIAVVTTSLRAEEVAQPVPARKNSISVDLAAVAERFRVVASPKAEGPRLEDAEIVVAGGRGLGSAQNLDLVKQLADQLGGMWAASRPLVDDGWVDSSRQVGLTGKITRPGLYVAAGISGASQHMAGCSAAKTIVAINKDADAAIFRYARYGIVGDCLQVLPELIKAAAA
ncbi:MAG: electron transfer flavoprotein subunit alpha/FixB family protein [Betaproteobacteria bacterium]|nr:electron transfer flavoprotein subunit alpha/FixB family protein [Rhodocyclales bacterium]